jgi:PAS domain S-box-containing protein
MLDNKEKFNFLDTGEVIFPSDYLIISETDSRGNISYVNKNFCDIAGYTEEEVMGKPHNIVRHPDMPKVAFSGLWDTIKRGQTWNGIVKNLSKHGNYYWVNATVFTSKDKEGNLKYISVRTKATDEEVKKAEDLYKTLI